MHALMMRVCALQFVLLSIVTTGRFHDSFKLSTDPLQANPTSTASAEPPDRDVLDTGLSLAQLVIAIIGLGGGGYAGGRAASIARMRMDDRRVLLDALLPGLEDIPRRAGRDLLRSADVFTEQYSKVDNKVGLLGLVDRTSWRRVTEVAPHEPIRYLRRQLKSIAADTARQQSSFRQDEQATLDSAVGRAKLAATTAWRTAIVDWSTLETRYCTRLHEFEAHLQRQLRGALPDRIRSYRYIVLLIRWQLVRWLLRWSGRAMTHR